MHAMLPYNPYHVCSRLQAPAKHGRAYKSRMHQACYWDDEEPVPDGASVRAADRPTRRERELQRLRDSVNACSLLSTHTFKANAAQIRAAYAAAGPAAEATTRTRIGDTVFVATRHGQVSKGLMRKLTDLLQFSFDDKEYNGMSKRERMYFGSAWESFDKTTEMYRQLALLSDRKFEDIQDFEDLRDHVLSYDQRQEFVLWGHAVDEPDVVTCACLLRYYRGESALMQNMCAHPRGRGIGSALLRYVKTFCTDRGISQLKCTVVDDASDTAPLLRLYERHGFVPEPNESGGFVPKGGGSCGGGSCGGGSCGGGSCGGGSCGGGSCDGDSGDAYSDWSGDIENNEIRLVCEIPAPAVRAPRAGPDTRGAPRSF